MLNINNDTLSMAFNTPDQTRPKESRTNENFSSHSNQSGDLSRLIRINIEINMFQKLVKHNSPYCLNYGTNGDKSKRELMKMGKSSILVKRS